MEALARPVNSCRTAENVLDVFRELQCFPLLREMDDACPFGVFEQPVDGLATVLWRSCGDVDAAFDVIKESRPFGELGTEAFKQLRRERAEGEERGGRDGAKGGHLKRLGGLASEEEVSEEDMSGSAWLGLILPSRDNRADEGALPMCQRVV